MGACSSCYTPAHGWVCKAAYNTRSSCCFMLHFSRRGKHPGPEPGEPGRGLGHQGQSSWDPRLSSKLHVAVLIEGTLATESSTDCSVVTWTEPGRAGGRRVTRA
jgi:hypothetical protein